LLLYFLIAGIFFPRYRTYVKDGWRCFIDKLRGRKCAASFDNRMRLAFSMWLTKHHMSRLGKFFYSERNFKLTFTILGIVFTIISIYLFILLIHFQINPPCNNNTCSVVPE
jgi:UDP-N-acetylmuramyl pentapeptide phosphotransferase/UDP-N-acetylglucosamine-1-phosphate transferase